VQQSPSTKTGDGSDAPGGIGRGLVWLMTISVGLIVGNLYYIQPLLGDIARELGVSEGQVGIAATLSQLGQAVGILFFLPIGDTQDRRILAASGLGASSLGLVGIALAPGLVWLCVASLVLGLSSVSTHTLVALAAARARPSERGRIVGMVMSGLLMGILLARTISGFVGAQLGWRTMFWIAAAVTAGLAVVLARRLPVDPPRPGPRYTALLASLAHLFREQPVLREACLYGAMTFGSFGAFWVTLTFHLEAPPFNYGSDVVGLFGLVGAAGALAASTAGRIADQRDPRRLSALMVLLTAISFAFMALVGKQLWGLIVGVVLLDLGVQAAHIANQARIHALIPEARNRLHTLYMFTYFAGGSLGTALGSWAWEVAGWTGVCAVGTLLPLVALLAYPRFRRRHAAPQHPAHAAGTAHP
jgi:predicted MFS family arabinose efflux permease